MNENNIETFVPLYISNYCDGECSICNMRKTNKKLIRIEANKTQIRDQLKIIKEIEGITAICFLTGEFNLNSIKRKSNLQLISWCIKEAFNQNFEKVYFNIGALTDNEIYFLKTLFLSYKDRLVLSIFQETYSKKTFNKFFGSNNPLNAKSDYSLRYSTPIRWIEAGFKLVDIGILLGFTNINSDIEGLIQHANILLEKNAKVFISLPRIIGIKLTKNLVEDDQFKKIIVYIKSQCPNTKIIITTREKIPIIKSLLPMIDIVSPGSSDIIPYTKEGNISNNILTSQFQVKETRMRPSEVLKLLNLEKIKYFMRKE